MIPSPAAVAPYIVRITNHNLVKSKKLATSNWKELQCSAIISRAMEAVSCNPCPSSHSNVGAIFPAS
jgi:hypothetical protein